MILSGFTHKMHHLFQDKFQVVQMNIKSLNCCSLNKKKGVVSYNSKSTPGWGAHLKPLFQMNWHSFSVLTKCCSSWWLNRIYNFNRNSNNESYDRIAVLLDFLKAGIVQVNCMFQMLHGQSLKMNRIRYLTEWSVLIVSRAICLFVNSHKADECCLSFIISCHFHSSSHLQSAV